ncbi:MAG: hypothetical protein H7Z11_03150 [Verrucomicrobia bacterium]|nr:hypothetical protein [Leptolyngbya sp. ES-bin-22]
MLVILMDNQLLSPHTVCQTCLMADQSGKPRWQSGKLYCGRAIRNASDRNPTEQQPDQFECQMGFRIADIEEFTERQSPIV